MSLKNADSCSLKSKQRCGNWTELNTVVLFRFIKLSPVRVSVGLRSSLSDFIFLSNRVAETVRSLGVKGYLVPSSWEVTWALCLPLWVHNARCSSALLTCSLMWSYCRSWKLQCLGVVFVNEAFLRASDLLLVTVAWSSFCHDLLRSIC